MKFLEKFLNAVIPGRRRRQERDSFIMQLSNTTVFVEPRSDMPPPMSIPRATRLSAGDHLRAARAHLVAELGEEPPTKPHGAGKARHWAEAEDRMEVRLIMIKKYGPSSENPGRDNLNPIGGWYTPRVWTPVWLKFYECVDGEYTLKPDWEIPDEEEELAMPKLLQNTGQELQLPKAEVTGDDEAVSV